jgi:hypothetical protein
MIEALCLGGPKDGQWVSAEKLHLVTYEAPVLGAPAEILADLPNRAEVRKFVYHQVELAGMHFWIGVDSRWQVPDVMKRLAECYRPPSPLP